MKVHRWVLAAMLVRTWLLIFAIGVLACEEAKSQAHPTEPPSRADAAGDNEKAAPAGSQSADLSQEHTTPLITALDSIEAAIRDAISDHSDAESDQPSETEKRDLDAQEGMALWAEWMFYASALSVVATFAGLFMIARTLHHTRRAADYARDMVQEAKSTTAAAMQQIGSERAWITADGYQFGNIEDGRIGGVMVGKIYTVAPTWRNTGRSPALKVFVFADAIFLNADQTEIPTFTPNDPPRDEAVLGPGVSVEATARPISGAELSAFQSGRVRWYVYSRATYVTVFDHATVRHSEVCYQVIWNGYLTKPDGTRGDPNFRVTAVGPQNTTT